MINEVESLILQKQGNIRDLNFSERNSYLLYRNIWNFILETGNFDFYNTIISIKFHISNGDVSISKEEDIKYKLLGTNVNCTWIGYYNNCDSYKIRSLIKTNIDLDIFIKLITNDNFIYKRKITDDGLILDMMISREKVNKIINDVIQSNAKVKVLKKED